MEFNYLEFKKVNLDLTTKLINKAIEQNVDKIIFLSSVTIELFLFKIFLSSKTFLTLVVSKTLTDFLQIFAISFSKLRTPASRV